MGIQVYGIDGTVQKVDQPLNAARVSLWPGPELCCVSRGIPTGVLPSGTAAGAILFALRNTGANYLLARRVTIGFALATNFTVAQRVEFGVALARGWTAFETGGNSVSFTDGRHKQTMPPLSAEARVATTAGLTAGAGRTLDTQYLGIAHGGASAATNSMPPMNVISIDAGDYPIVLAQNEGFVVVNNFLFGAGGSGVVYINFEVAEVTVAKWEGNA